MSQEGVLTLVASDLLPSLPFQFESEAGDGTITPVPLSLYSTIELRMRRSDGVLIIRPHTAIDVPGGVGEFQWSSGDLIAGIHLAEIRRVTVAGSLPQTFPSSRPLILDLRSLV